MLHLSLQADEIEVTVHILNENDNSPVFDKTSYSFNAVYKEHGIIGTVHAYDSDSPGESIKYSFLPSEVR